MPPPDERMPPCDIDAEMGLLGCLLVYESAADRGVDWSIDDTRAILSPEAFFREDHRVIFKAIVDAHEAGVKVDLITLIPLIKAAAKCDGGHWQNLCLTLAESFCSVFTAPYYARQVRSAWQRREIIRNAESATR